ncbi:hypothetical protein [Candidatus Parabeggiatoa sp. HSG14]|uniref:hypothetical protein n=1 Tax=Candidatus Parabeggiatoa sp. HSG14 TaxID=3055593 RepID=UPI0025A92CB7|nr:hypothetical protein [Thiotrichales bacterium HSG14]
MKTALGENNSDYAACLNNLAHRRLKTSQSQFSDKAKSHQPTAKPPIIGQRLF